MQTVSKAQPASPENEESITRYEKQKKTHSQEDKAAFDKAANAFFAANDLSPKQWDRMSHKYRRMYDEGKAPRSRGSFVNEPDRGSDLEDGDSSPESDDLNQQEEDNQDFLRHESDEERTPVIPSASSSSRPSRQGFTYTRLSAHMHYELSRYWFTISRKPSPQARNILWQHLKKLDDTITESQVTRWFENRRAAEKRQKVGKK